MLLCLPTVQSELFRCIIRNKSAVLRIGDTNNKTIFKTAKRFVLKTLHKMLKKSDTAVYKIKYNDIVNHNIIRCLFTDLYLSCDILQDIDFYPHHTCCTVLPGQTPWIQ